jgi:hypothetical protein
LRFVQDQFFAIAEVQAPADRPEAVGLCQSVGLEQVDVGTTYRKEARKSGHITPLPEPTSSGE